MNHLILKLSLPWVHELTPTEYKSNTAVATLINLVTLLHNYVSHEFAETKKPFCENP